MARKWENLFRSCCRGQGKTTSEASTRHQLWALTFLRKVFHAREVRDKRGIDKRPHDLRRAAATRFTAAGMSEIEAMSITGHETPSMFRRYNIIDAKRQRAALAKVAAPSLQPK